MTASNSLKQALAQAMHPILRALLKPIARFMLKNGIKLQQLREVLNQALVDEAVLFLKNSGNQENISRISVMTGIHRREVTSLLENKSQESYIPLTAKVIGVWQHSKLFKDKDSNILALSVGGEGSQFSALVRSVNKELNPATVLFELERTGVVSIVDGVATLIKQTFSSPESYVAGAQILAADIGDLMIAVDENLNDQNQDKNLHARTVYDAIRREDLRQIKEWIKSEGHEFHKKIREKLSEYDQDVNPVVGYTGGLSRVIISSFSRIEDVYED
jgi:hypothetical protein